MIWVVDSGSGGGLFSTRVTSDWHVISAEKIENIAKRGSVVMSLIEVTSL